MAIERPSELRWDNELNIKLESSNYWRMTIFMIIEKP